MNSIAFLLHINMLPNKALAFPTLVICAIAMAEERCRFSPSQWGLKSTSLNDHLKFIEEESIKTRKLIPNELNISYGNNDREKLDVFGTDLPDDAPIFVFIHGGYWQMLSKDEYNFVATTLYQKGLKTFVIDYDLCPNVTVAEIVQQARRAIKHVLKYAKSKGSRGIYLSGHSAGGQLVASLFMDGFFNNLSNEERSLVKEVYFLSGVFDLVDLLTTDKNIKLKLNESSATAVSPLRQSLSNTNSTAKFYVVTCDHDAPGLIEHSEKFSKKLIELGWNSKYVFLKNADHFTIVENYSKSDYEIVTSIQLS